MPETREKSNAAFERALHSLVGGVNSPVRAFTAVGGNPVFMARAAGGTITDIDGNRYIDYVCGYGPMILGHCHERVTTAINKAVRDGLVFGAPSETETNLAKKIISLVDAVEKVRFINSGTEAVMTAIRLARGVTGRDMIVKFNGCYHGHSDSLLVAAGSGAMTLGTPSSAGVTKKVAHDTLTAEYNDVEGIETLMAARGKEVAAILVEPVAGNMGVIPPLPGFLESIRSLCTRHGALMIADEVMTGFRLAAGGAQEWYGFTADLTTMGKIIGGGMPIGAVGGPADIMDHLAPLGDVYQAGTLSGNSPAMCAGLATLDVIIGQQDFYTNLEEIADLLEKALAEAAEEAGIADRVFFSRVGSMLSCFFTPGKVTDFTSASTANTRAFAAFFGSMLDNGIYIAPSQFEALFVSAAHTIKSVQATRRAAGNAFAAAAEHLT